MALSCPNCQTQLPDDAAFCYKCGTPTAEQTKEIPRFCMSCGVQLRDDAQFCLACGAAVTDETPWHEKHNEQVEKELRSDLSEFIDFEENKTAILARTYKRIRHEQSRMSARDWFNSLWWLRVTLRMDGIPNSPPVDADDELFYFRTNKPNAHKALALKTTLQSFMTEAITRGYIDHEGYFTPKTITYFEWHKINPPTPGAYAQWPKEDLQIQIDYSKLDELAKKDDELFPPPQSQRVEVAGAIINFTTDEGVLVVYMDCDHLGKTLRIEKFSELSYSDYPVDTTADIRELKAGNSVLCAAIFNHIPFVTNELRNKEKSLTQMNCTVSTYHRFTNRWEETVTVRRGQVTELDWRGRK